MPNRILKESVKSSEQVDRLKPDEEAFLYRLFVTVDDFGRMDARPQILASAIYPLRRTPHSVVQRRLTALVREGIVELYEWNGRPYLFFPTWGNHQRIRNQNSKYPDPPGTARAVDSESPRVAAGGSEMRPKSESDSQSETKSEVHPSSNDGQTTANGEPSEFMKTWLARNPFVEAPQ